MSHAVTDKKGQVSIYEAKKDREECQCKFDIITLPESIFDPLFVKRLKAQCGPINIEDYEKSTNS